MPLSGLNFFIFLRCVLSESGVAWGLQRTLSLLGELLSYACGGALRYGFGKASDSADLEFGLSSFTGGLL